MQYVKAFIAGFLSTIAFHQTLFWLLTMNASGPSPAFDFSTTAPLGVPKMISIAFWGGVWGIALWPLVRRYAGRKYWAAAILLGAIGPSLVAWFVVMPLKGMGPAGNFDPRIIIGALLLNAAWGLGYGLIMHFAQRRG